MDNQPTWKDLYLFIQKKIKEDGESFLDNKIMIECQDPNNINPGFEKMSDSEDWIYCSPAWIKNDDGSSEICSTHFLKEKIVTININY